MSNTMLEIGVLMPIGLVVIWVGFMIWKKEKIALIHSYHYKNVGEEDKMPYTAMMGKATILLGIGIGLTGIINFITKTAFGWVVFYVCFASGLVIMIRAQIKYNHGIF